MASYKAPNVFVKEVDKNFKDAKTVTLTCENCECVVAMGGATVLSWKVDGKEQFYCVPDPQFVAGKTPYRGGVPICWPAFATKNPQVGKHGFVRQSNRWELVDQKIDPYVVQTTFEFRMTSEEARGDLPYAEENGVGAGDSVVILRSIVTLNPYIFRQELQVMNGSKLPLPFSTCLHNYFLLDERDPNGKVVVIPNWTKMREPVLGNDSTIFDNLSGGQAIIDIKGDIEIERFFAGVPQQPITIGSKLELTRSPTLPDIVVWNIGQSNKRPGDLPAEDVTKYVCVEPAVCDFAVVVAPGETWRGSQKLQYKC